MNREEIAQARRGGDRFAAEPLICVGIIANLQFSLLYGNLIGMRNIIRLIDKLYEKRHQLLFLVLNSYVLYWLPQICANARKLEIAGIAQFLTVMLAVILLNVIFLMVYAAISIFLVACEVSPKAIAQVYAVRLAVTFSVLAQHVFTRMHNLLPIIRVKKQPVRSPQQHSSQSRLPYGLYSQTCVLLN